MFKFTRGEGNRTVQQTDKEAAEMKQEVIKKNHGLNSQAVSVVSNEKSDV